MSTPEEERETETEVAADLISDRLGELLCRNGEEERGGLPRGLDYWSEGDSAVILLEGGRRLVATVRIEENPGR